MNNLKKYKYLYFILGSTLSMVLYLRFFLSDYSKCFSVEVGINSLGLTFYYTVEIVKEFFELRTLEQLNCYREFLKIWDPIFAIVYTLMYSSWIIYFFKNKYYFLVVPFLVMITDWVENYIELMMLENFINSDILSPTLVLFGSGINTLRWLLFSAIYLLIIIGIVKAIKLYYKKSVTK
tara:strand:- start:997 stop:1533 length:537 start_codon:yes stop_codon:yes gene_type:complete